MQKKSRIILLGILIGTLLLGVVVICGSRARSASAASAVPVVHSPRSAPAAHPDRVADGDYCAWFSGSSDWSTCVGGYGQGQADASTFNCNQNDYNGYTENTPYDYGYKGGWSSICPTS